MTQDGNVRAGEGVRGARYLIRKGGAYYRKNSQGYTHHREAAGRYRLEEAIAITHPNGPDGPRDGMDYVLDTAALPQERGGDEVQIPEGMKPWGGGDNAPADWDGREVLGDDGAFYAAQCWQRPTGGIDIIAYTPKSPVTLPDTAARDEMPAPEQGKLLDRPALLAAARSWWAAKMPDSNCRNVVIKGNGRVDVYWSDKDEDGKYTLPVDFAYTPKSPAAPSDGRAEALEEAARVALVAAVATIGRKPLFADLTRAELTYIVRKVKDALAHTAPMQGERTHAVDIEAILRAVYDDHPFTAISVTMVEATGVPMGEVIPYDAFKATGGDDSGTRKLAISILKAAGLSATSPERPAR